MDLLVADGKLRQPWTVGALTLVSRLASELQRRSYSAPDQDGYFQLGPPACSTREQLASVSSCLYLGNGPPC